MDTETVAGFRLSPQQQRLWTLQLGSPVLESRAVVMLQGEVDPCKLQQALRSCLERHEILRTSYGRTAGSRLAAQVIGDQPDFAWSEIDGGGWPDAERDARVDELLWAEAGRPGSTAPPSLVAVLVRLAADEWRLVLRASSLSVDGAAFEPLTRELARFYAGRPPDDEAIQYADLTEWLHEILEEASPNGWATHAERFPEECGLPFLRTGRPGASAELRGASRALTGGLVQRLERGHCCHGRAVRVRHDPLRNRPQRIRVDLSDHKRNVWIHAPRR